MLSQLYAHERGFVNRMPVDQRPNRPPIPHINSTSTCSRHSPHGRPVEGYVVIENRTRSSEVVEVGEVGGWRGGVAVFRRMPAVCRPVRRRRIVHTKPRGHR
ncbi:hypothetical protein EVAR_61780_1 [Eumeta japonica]|uniref:Uncharacterized protein n=1 Tax=Eumeta variegata TaxID=151549 RepID=A0A4C1Z2C7_EUMVA|nr:hypothetical protein EVAR_61780_1 [Eumeta japonica]